MNTQYISDKSRAKWIEDINMCHFLADSLGVDLVEWEGLLVLEDFRFFLETASDKQYSEICNGAGPKNFGYLVPDTMYLLNLEIVFDEHDFCYDKFDSKEGKTFSDLLMKLNSMLFIEKHTTKCPMFRYMLVHLREIRAYEYYSAVSIGGDLFY